MVWVHLCWLSSKPIFLSAGNEEDTRKAEGKKNVVQMEKPSHANVSGSKNLKNLFGKRTNSNRSEVHEAGLQGTPIINSGENLRRTGPKGKVKEFVSIFNHETSSKSKITVDSRSQSSKWKAKSTSGPDYEESVSTSRVDKEMHLPNLTQPRDASILVFNLNISPHFNMWYSNKFDFTQADEST